MGLNNHTWAFTPKSSMSEVMVNRFAILCGPLAQLCFVIFLPAGLLLPPISPSLSPEQTAEHYRKNLTGMKAGISIMLMTAVFWPIFCAGVNRQLSRIPHVNPTLLWAQLAGGALGGVSMMLPAVFFAATTYRLDRDPVATQTLSDLSWFSFSMLFPPFIAQDLALSWAILSDKRAQPLFPRWLAYATTGLTLTFYPALGVHCVHHGAVAWNGALGFWLGAAGFGLQVGLLVRIMLNAAGKPDLEHDDGVTTV